jgi:hypothetical protein
MAEVFSDDVNLKIGDLLSRPISTATRAPFARPLMLTRPINAHILMSSRAPCTPARQLHARTRCCFGEIPFTLARPPDARTRCCLRTARAPRADKTPPTSLCPLRLRARQCTCIFGLSPLFLARDSHGVKTQEPLKPLPPMENSLLKHRHLEAGPCCLYLIEDLHDSPLEAHTTNALPSVLLAHHPQDVIRLSTQRPRGSAYVQDL